MCYGISIYLSEPDSSNKNWIQKAAENGFQYIFTSLHIPEEKGFSFVEKVKWLGETAQTFHMEVMADVSPSSLERLGLEFENLPVLKDWGISGVRMDYGFSAKQIAWLSHSLKIGLNASTVDEEQLQELLSEGLLPNQSEAWHNFYPKPYTGISRNALRERNELFHRYGIKTMAFIPGDDRLRGPLLERLPTIEDHRNVTPLHAALELKQLQTDKICVGDISLTEQSIKDINYLTEQVIPVYTKFDEDYESLYDSIHSNRMDASEYVVRSVESRSMNLHDYPLPHAHTHFNRGVITVDNKLYGRYAGEIQICLSSLPVSEKTNVAGVVSNESESILQFIGNGQKFVFIKERRT